MHQLLPGDTSRTRPARGARLTAAGSEDPLAGLELAEEPIALRGRSLEILRPRDGEALLDEKAFDRDEFMPYWAELWPSGLALARTLDGRALKGARVLELGCGLGLPAIAAALAGGRVLATDWAADAVAVTAENARRNAVRLETRVCSWYAPQEILARGPWDLVLAADVLYEERNVGVLTELLPRLVGARGELWLADPGRASAEAFLREAAGRWSVRTVGASSPAHVSVHRMRLA